MEYVKSFREIGRHYQEIGRAGRDGQPCYIILFYNPKDKKLPESFIEGGRPSTVKEVGKLFRTFAA
ncbi:MAG: hypothetical protein AABZ32_12195, partial [Bacteroidota bacterium]